MAQEPTPAKAGAKVYVGCKLPNGIILQNYVKVEGHDVHQARGPAVLINGSNTSRVINGYGITEVDADFMNEWMKNNQDFPSVTAGLIFIQGSSDKAESDAKERAAVVSGLEPINQQALGPALRPEVL